MIDLDDHPVVLEVRNLSKRFPVGGMFGKQQVHALNDVSFSIRVGEVVALVGESGSGKSTTARLIARLMQPSSGEILFKGKNMLKVEPRGASLGYRNRVQMIFQDPFSSLNPVHTIGHHIARPLLLHHKVQRRRDREGRINELLAKVGLNPPADFASKFPYQLSGGQRQRIAIARALAVDPEIILADEPISMLDVSIRIGVLNLLAQLKKDYGIGYLYITHDIASARYIGDKTMVMYAGHIVEGAESSELMEHPSHPYTQLLLSAVPNPHSLDQPTRLETRGEIPSLIDPPPGCPFAARCPHVKPICREVMPSTTMLSADHWVRCHLYGSDNSAAQPAA
ncbi:MAG: ABC transporter ATP-binding protein [Herpetosiphonaceae bacterium]|nr:ABC transporter ATP-binding protein [Herpetosiphonaceae bacterium]